MPALSQNLTFTINSSTSVQLVYPNTATSTLTYFSDHVKGEGYFNSSNGMHTIQFQINEFVGTIEMQGTLVTEPSETDWVSIQLHTNMVDESILTVDTTGLISNTFNTFALNYSTATSTVKILNLIGNYVWLRAKISNFDQGIVSSIKYNF